MSRPTQFNIARRMRLRAVKKQTGAGLARQHRPMNQGLVEAILARHGK